MLSTIMGFVGIKNLASPITWLVGISLIFGGAATWLREDAINDTNAKWELKLSQEALKAHNEVQEKQLVVEKLQAKLALKEIEDVAKAKEDAEALAKQAVDFPLSPDCLKCRIPNERIWVRGAKDMAPKPGAANFSKAPGS